MRQASLGKPGAFSNLSLQPPFYFSSCVCSRNRRRCLKASQRCLQYLRKKIAHEIAFNPSIPLIIKREQKKHEATEPRDEKEEKQTVRFSARGKRTSRGLKSRFGGAVFKIARDRSVSLTATTSSACGKICCLQLCPLHRRESAVRRRRDWYTTETRGWAGKVEGAEMKRTFNLQELAWQICGDATGIGNKYLVRWQRARRRYCARTT